MTDVRMTVCLFSSMSCNFVSVVQDYSFLPKEPTVVLPIEKKNLKRLVTLIFDNKNVLNIFDVNIDSIIYSFGNGSFITLFLYLL